ncbi:hypothetical protein LCI18_012302 [Fusarium solani-melongenae]|uniref:Uncharacterized protein n=1 Tax=Fusarium solani subsp. cucurbitae TaxID=2747967 RepID=A0ACD3ZK96_FUSSC|nr:hypothetical protein LCI18_012302 [Fusarium solani-melongenae]
MLRSPAATRLPSTTPTPPRRPRSTPRRSSMRSSMTAIVKDTQPLTMRPNLTSTSVPKAGDNKEKNPGNVAGGLKSTLSNPNASDEAKESAKDRLNKMGE